MKKVILVIAFLLYCSTVEAFLINRGTDTLGNRLIYDDDLKITWYDYTAVNTWQNQRDWASNLSVSFGGTIYDNWRLPTTVDDLYVFGTDGTTTGGYNITTSELGHLYYAELGNLGYFDTNGTGPQPGLGLNNTGDFQNLESDIYWSGTEYATNTINAWSFTFSIGRQATDFKGGYGFTLAVLDGDVASDPIPEPSTIALLGIGLAGLAGLAGAEVRRRRKKKAVDNS